jgi:deoxyribodipyrimidine photolyase
VDELFNKSNEQASVFPFWFRRDLRLEDNIGLFHALKSPYPVITYFIDEAILNKLPKMMLVLVLSMKIFLK